MQHVAQRGAVGGVAGQHLVAKRKAVGRHDQRDHHLHAVAALVAAVADRPRHTTVSAMEPQQFVLVGAVNAANLTVLLVQNGVHAASSGQVLANSGLDLAQLARAAGIVNAIATPHALAGAMRCSPGRGGSKVLVLATQVVHPPIVLDPILSCRRLARRVTSRPCSGADSSKTNRHRPCATNCRHGEGEEVRHRDDQRTSTRGSAPSRRLLQHLGAVGDNIPIVEVEPAV
jgi:hypothetical protein